MTNQSVLYKIFSDLVAAMNTVIESKYIFLKDRPDINKDGVPMSRFAVIDLPVTIRDTVIGGRKTMLNTNGVLYLFTQSRANSTLDVNTTGEYVDDVMDLFPISGTYCVATNPAVRMTGSDGTGFQVTTISFDLRCRWRAFD